MTPDLNPDPTSTDLIADRPATAASSCVPPTEDGSPHRASRLRHRVGLAAAIVAGAGSIGLGADLASAAPLPEHLSAPPGLVSADEPANGEDSTAADGPATGDQQGTDDQNADDQSPDDQGAATSADDNAAYVESGEDGNGEDRNGADGQGSDDGSDDSSGANNGDIQQGWDGSVYWFQNGSGEWRYTSHRDVYLNRIGSDGSSGSGTDNGDGSDSGSRSGSRSGSAGDRSVAGSGADRADASTSAVETAVDFAEAQLGKPFIWGGNGPSGYDCSGLTQQSYRRAGVSLPRIADEQFTASTPVSASRMRRGDLLFWSSDGSVDGIHHVALYLGSNRYIEAAHPGTNIRTATLNSGYFPDFIARP